MSTLVIRESRRLRAAVKMFLESHKAQCRSVRNAMSLSQHAVSNSWHMSRLIKEYLKEKDEARKRGLGMQIVRTKAA